MPTGTLNRIVTLLIAKVKWQCHFFPRSYCVCGIDPKTKIIAYKVMPELCIWGA